MAHFLVTGGAGFTGSDLVDALLKQGHRVRLLHDLSSGHRHNLPPQMEFLQADVTNRAAIEHAFEEIDAGFHLAAIASRALE